MIYVTRDNLEDCLSDIPKHTFLSLDTETTGLKITDKMFSLQIYTGTEGYYFNFNSKKDAENKFAPHVLNKFSVLEKLSKALRKEQIVFMHDAKFDLMMINKEGYPLSSEVWCTMSMARILKNTSMGVSLERSCEDWDVPTRKNKMVEQYLSRHKLNKKVYILGKDKAIVESRYDLVCHDLMFRYGMDDAKATYELGRILYAKIQNAGNTQRVAHNERELIGPLCRMQERGIRVNTSYIKKASQYETERIKSAKDTISRMAGKEYTSGPKWLQTVFQEKGYPFKTTKTGIIATDKKTMRTYDNPLVRELQKLRKFEKNLGTYYSSFIYYTCPNPVTNDDLIHADIRQSGTQTGRMSYREPNLQNLPKKEDDTDEYSIRKCFIPREDYVFVSIDYDQQEYRLMLDLAGELDMIDKIVNHGLDVHQLTADKINVTRDQAKTINFAILYGMGAASLAEALKISVGEATSLKRKYFSALPKVREWSYGAIKDIKIMSFINNWFGRPLKNMEKFNYKTPNYLVQGGCGDVIKIAMNRIDNFLRMQNTKSAMLVQVHDELLFEIHIDELHLIKPIKEIMEGVYEGKNGMKLTCSSSWSAVSWSNGDMLEGEPDREQILAQQSKEGLRQS